MKLPWATRHTPPSHEIPAGRLRPNSCLSSEAIVLASDVAGCFWHRLMVPSSVGAAEEPS